MPMLSEDRWIIGFLVAVVAWALFGLPFIYLNWQWLLNDAAGFFTFVLVIVGVLQLGLFVWQLRLIRESLTDAEFAAKVAQEAAAAATQQAQTAEKSFVSSQRPWVGIDNISDMPLNVGHEPSVVLSMKNTGPGAAVHVRAKTIGGVRTIEEITPDPPTEVPEEAGVVMLMPNSFYRYRPFNGHAPLTNAQAVGFNAKTHVGWIVGRVEYEGGLGDRHETTFRLEYIHPHGWEATERGNKAT